MLHKIIALPEWVVRYAPKYLSDSEFVLMLQMQDVRTKQDWLTVANWLNYKSIGPITTMINRLEAAELVRLPTRYTVDWTPLFNRCFEVATGLTPPPMAPPPPKPKARGEYALYSDLTKVAPLYLRGSKDNWAKVVLPKLLEQFDPDTILAYCAAMEADYTISHKRHPQRMYGIFPSSIMASMLAWQAANTEQDTSHL